MAADDLARRLARLEDREEIRDVVIRYATALDSRDWTLLAEVFAPDGAADYGALAGTPTGPTEIAEACRQVLAGLDASQHMLGNIAVDADGSDRATATSYFRAQHYLVGDNGANTYVVAGVYTDRLRRTADGWRIDYRTLTPTWTDGNAGIFPMAQARLAAREAAE